MEDYSKCRKENNKMLFKEYFLTTWTANNLPQEKFLFIKQLFAINESELINKFVLDVIKKNYDSKINLLISENKEIKNIYNENNKAYNISLGDVIYVINNLKNSFADVEDARFFFAIETFYSMRLYEYYDLMPETLPKIDVNNHEIDSNISSNVKKKSILESYNDYTKLVGCNLVNPSSNSTYLYRKFNIQTLKNVWEGILQASKDNYPLLNLHLIEFYSLCFSVKVEKQEIDANYRNKDEVAFDSKIGTNQKWIAFDFISIFSNLPRIEKQYKRISEYLKLMCQSGNEENMEFLALAKENENSLYNQIVKYCEENRPYSKNKYMSWVTIRNMEVLDDFVQFINRIWIKSEKDYLASLEKILETIVDKRPENDDNEKYKIFTYDYNEKEFYKITFNFLKVLLDLFEKEDFRNLFNEVESKSESSNSDKREGEEKKEKITIDSLVGKTGSTAREQFYKLHPEFVGDRNAEKIINEFIANKMRISSIKKAKSVEREILEAYKVIVNE